MHLAPAILSVLLTSASAQLHWRNARSLSNDTLMVPWNITFAEYLPSSSVSAVNFIITRLTSSVCQGYDSSCPVQTSEIDTLCTGVWTRNSSSNATTWQECSYYQYENGTKAGNLLPTDNSLRWRLVDEHAYDPYGFNLDVQRNNQTWEYGFNSTNLVCAFVGRGGIGEDCRLNGSFPRGVLLGSGNATSNGTATR